MSKRKRDLIFVAIVLGVAFAIRGCGDDPTSDVPGFGEAAPYRPEGPEAPGAAIAILVDTSGSMGATVAGDARPKHVVAREALAKTLDTTDAFLARRPGFPVKVCVIQFADGVHTVLPIGPYDRAKVQAALSALPAPEGSTALGLALDAARQELYRSGCYRKYVLALTDGENTKGIEPEPMAREIHRRSEGGVPIYFVAFDTDPAKFGFLRDVGGDVVSARNASELATVLTSVYEGRILAEAIDAE